MKQTYHRGNWRELFFLFLAVVGITGIVGTIALWQTPSSPYSQLQKAPNFSMRSFEGDYVRFEELRGKPVILYFWAAWCPYCETELPIFEKFRQQYPDVIILGIHRSETESREVALKFIAKTGASFRMFEDRNNHMFRYFGRGSFVPLTVFINSDGYIEETVIGPRSEERFREFIELIRS